LMKRRVAEPESA